MEKQDEDEHETARLVLMCGAGWRTGFGEFAKEMREVYPGMPAGRLKQIYEAYCGWDQRLAPWLSIETGKRL